MENKGEKILSLLNDESFIGGLDKIDSVEGLRDAFEANGVELSLQETMDVIQVAGSRADDGELDEAALEDVAGGIGIKALLSGMWKAFKKGWKLGGKFYEWEKRVLGN